MNGWVVAYSCPVCEGKVIPYRTIISSPAMLVNFCDGDLPVLTQTNFIQCSSCGLVIQSPRMTDERLRLYYSSGLYRQTLGIEPETMDNDEQRRAVEVAAFLRGQGVKVNSHLDIGCSRGYLLREYDAPVRIGYDANENYQDFTVATRKELKTYDLVTSIHVLEHVSDPVKELQWYASLTDRYLCIEVPGQNCTGGPLRFAHLWYFPPETLKKMIENAGLKIAAKSTEPNTRYLCVKG